MDYVTLLAEIGAEQNFTVVYVEIEELSKANRSTMIRFWKVKLLLYLDTEALFKSSEILKGGIGI